MSVVEGAKCFHSIACSLMVSLLLSLAIQATINISSTNCDEDQNIGKGKEKCEFTSERIWALTIFYTAAIIFIVGIIGDCFSNGIIILIYLICFVVLIVMICGLIIFRMIADKKDFGYASNAITRDVIPERWGVWATVVKCVLLITGLIALLIGSFLVFYYFQYNKLSK